MTWCGGGRRRERTREKKKREREVGGRTGREIEREKDSESKPGVFIFKNRKNLVYGKKPIT